MFSKKDNGRGNVCEIEDKIIKEFVATFLTLPNEKTTFLENISTKDDAARRCFPKRTTDGATFARLKTK